MAFSFTFTFHLLLLVPSVVYVSTSHVQDPELVVQEVEKYVTTIHTLFAIFYSLEKDKHTHFALPRKNTDIWR